jgi:hypothetical protein
MEWAKSSGFVANLPRVGAVVITNHSISTPNLKEAPMTPARLLRDGEGLRHDDRIRRMVEIGRQSRKDHALADTLARLEVAGFYERYLSLLACHGSRDGEHVLRSLCDPSGIIRARAARLLILVCDDEQIALALPQLSRELRKSLLSRLRKARRLAAIDAYLDELERRGDRDLEVFVPFGTASAVERRLAAAEDRGGQVFWLRLTRYHPNLALKLFRECLPSGERPSARFAWLCRAVFPLLSRQLPDEALALARELVGVVAPSSLCWDTLLRRRPRESADLLLSLRTRAVSQGSFNRLADRLDRDRVVALARRGFIDLKNGSAWNPWTPGRPYRWLAQLPTRLRGDVFAASRERRAPISYPVELLTLLPGPLRLREARRHQALRSLATKPASRLAYTSLLPWEEALALAEPYLNHPDAALRGAALSSLALALPLLRERAGDYLALVRERKNEQDPVRLAMMAALAKVPPVVWREEHLDDLGAVLRDALDAADLSGGTVAQANLLVLSQVSRHPDWTANWLTTIVRERGSIGWYRRDTLLGDADTSRIGKALLPVLRAWRARERDGQTLQLASALGRRLRVFDELLDLVEGIIRGTRQQSLAEFGLALLSRHARKRLAALVPELLREDPSWIICPTVHQYLSRRRQDLLTPFLGRKPVRGRFSSGKTRLVLPIGNGFVRWTASQQETFADTLREVIDDLNPTRETPAICTALQQLAAMPAVAPETLIARANDKRQAIRDTALRLLGRLDAGQGVAALLEALDASRARIAIYALRRALLDMPEAHALDLLRQVKRKKVTVAKEVVRLVGERGSDAAFAFLEEVEGAKPHRDVHVALLRALWTHLERPADWAMIDRAVKTGDAALMNAVVRIPADRLSETARIRLTTLLVELLRHPSVEVRLEVLRRCGDEPPEDPKHILLPALLAASASRLPEERAIAAEAVMEVCVGSDAERVARAVAEQTINRRTQKALIDALTDALADDRRRLGPVARAVVAKVAGDPVAAALRLSLATAALSGAQLQSLLKELDRSGWRPDVLMVAATSLEGQTHLNRPALQRLERELSSSVSPALRRLALAALVAQGRHGWDETRLDRLRAFRADTHALVSAAAQLTLPAEEEEE